MTVILPSGAPEVAEVPPNLRIRVVEGYDGVEWARLLDASRQEVAVKRVPPPEAPHLLHTFDLVPAEPLQPGATYYLQREYDEQVLRVASEPDLQPPSEPVVASGQTEFHHQSPNMCSSSNGWYGQMPVATTSPDVFFVVCAGDELVATNLSAPAGELRALVRCDSGVQLPAGVLILPVGRHVLDVRAVDAAGNQSPARKITVDAVCDIPIERHFGCAAATAEPAGWVTLLLMSAALLGRRKAYR